MSKTHVTEAIKPLPRKVPLMNVKMHSKEYKRRKNVALQISADSIIAIDSYENFEKSKKELQAQIDSKLATLHYASELYEILSGADYEADEKGLLKKDPQQGRPIPKAFDIPTQRTINRILDALETASKDDLETEFSVDLKPADIIYAADRVNFFYNNFVAQSNAARLEFFDYMMDLKGKAQAELDKKKDEPSK